MADKRYVVLALYNIDSGATVFNELIGTALSTLTAFQMLDKYDCIGVIKADYEMDVEEIGNAERSFGISSRNKKMYYVERHRFTYQIDGSANSGSATVEFTIQEA